MRHFTRSAAPSFRELKNGIASVLDACSNRSRSRRLFGTGLRQAASADEDGGVMDIDRGADAGGPRPAPTPSSSPPRVRPPPPAGAALQDEDDGVMDIDRGADAEWLA